MPTTSLNAYSIAYPAITDRIRVEIATQLDPLVIVASQTNDAPHPQRLWSFPGLERTNYVFEMWQIDDDDNKIVRLAYFDVVPGQVDGQLTRNFEQICVGLTPGLIAGENSFVFDGSGGAMSDLATHTDIGSGTSIYRVTFKGTPHVGDTITIPFSQNLNDIDPPISGVLFTECGDGDTLEDMIADLVAQAIDASTVNQAYTDYDGYSGVKIRAFSLVEASTSIGTTSGGLPKPDYRGWDINIAEIAGTNFLVLSTEYSWDKETGTFQYLEAGMIFSEGQWFNIQFVPITPPSGGAPVFIDYATRLIETSELLAVEDFGKILVVEPIDTYIELELPDVFTVPQGRKCVISMTNNNTPKCVKIKPFLGQEIKFLYGDLFICPNETLSIFKFTRGVGLGEYRILDAFGNFAIVGQTVYEDAKPDIVFNKVFLNGDAVSSLSYARLYNYVLSLDFDQVVDFDSWAVGNNKYKYSRANSSNPENTGLFHVPDRRSIFEKGSDGVIKAGAFNNDSVGEHFHFSIFNQHNDVNTFPVERGTDIKSTNSPIKGWTKGANGAEGYILDGSTSEPNVGKTSRAGAGISTQPKNVVVYKYVYC